jgi:rhodanese-related sulfurtransferase
MNVPTVTLSELPPDAVIVDVREPMEWSAGHIDGARHVPMSSIPDAVASDPASLGGEGTVYFMCAVGGRSAHVTAWLVQQGLDAVNIAGGMHAWENAGRPMISETGQAPVVL